jgi:hypothetical protein
MFNFRSQIFIMNKIKITYLFLLMLTLASFGCSVQRQTKFTSDAIKPGMTKQAVVSKYGKPYKVSSSIDKNQISHEDLYYKEQLYLGRWYEVNSILHFENSLFVSLEQGKERLLYKDAQVISK